MKSAIFAAVVALAVPAVYAQVPGLPECANTCVASSLSISGCDNASDFKCLCASVPFLTAVAGCFHGSCDPNVVDSATSAAHAFCQSVGVNIPPIMTTHEITVPVATSGPAITTPAETTSTPDGPETTTTTEVTVPTEIPIPTTPVVTHPTTTCPSTTLTTTTIYGTGSITQTRNITSPTVVPPPTNSEGAAVKNIASLSALVMAVVGFFAL
ncbi:hypothetical protein L211DRAFT_561738 [Terfezia boudieri ATCC MYA-4762]|uniref:CFEM domain-containing protein n=1 Tax=Terfezia boudieri ATCC MYA-4762 TaxID=1051890 RepID=A0A3N4M3W0_9PEZI|nr:hypothetical protein L211DRAFT_561738 [Terfezia boudieri ATCC MYA-4762]